MKEKPRDERRADAAEKLERKLAKIVKGLDAIPSFNGKARFMDEVIAASREAHGLAWDLRRDASEAARAE